MSDKVKIDLRLGDCIEILRTLPDNSVDSIVTDPPYGLEFMGKEWDTFKTGRIAKYKEGGDLDLEQMNSRKGKGGAGPSYTKRAASKCRKCNKQRWSGSPCKCEEPDFEIDNSTQYTFQGFTESWARECYRVLKPGGHLLAFGGSRMYHRLASGIEDAGFEVRDQIMWVYGSGFPKSHNIGKAIDKLQGNEREVLGTKADFSLDGAKRNPNNHREIGEAAKEISHEYGYKQGWEAPVTKGNSEWEGWGTALKPAHEPICMARKPLSEKSIAENVLKHRTGGINIDDCRIEFEDTPNAATNPKFRKENNYKMPEPGQESKGAVSFTSSKNEYDTTGRFPANIIFDEEAGKLLDEQSGVSKSGFNPKAPKKQYGGGVFGGGETNENTGYTDKGGASRFFYCPKVSKKERGDNNIHPTVKPIKLMEYLITLVTPKGGVVLEPFMGSGSTGIAAKNLGMSFIGIEKEQEYFDIAKQRIGE